MNQGFRTIFMVGVAAGLIALAPCFSFAQERGTANQTAPSPVPSIPSPKNGLSGGEYKVLKEKAQERRGTMKQNIQERRDVIKQNVQERRDTIKENIKERKDTILQNTKNRRDEMRQKMQERRDEIKSKLEAKREEFKAKAEARREILKKKLGGEKAQGIETSFGNIVERLDKEITRLNDLAGKLHAEIDKRSSSGQDVSKAMTLLSDAEIKIDDARKAFDAAKQKYADMIAAKDLRGSFKGVRTAVAEVISKIQIAHKALMAVIPALRSAGSGNATTTPSAAPAPASAGAPSNK